MAQYIYTLNSVGRLVPPRREVLKDISLSFVPGANIGMPGLLRSMAGVDKEYEGNYADYEADRRQRMGGTADQAHRIHYRRLAD